MGQSLEACCADPKPKKLILQTRRDRRAFVLSGMTVRVVATTVFVLVSRRMLERHADASSARAIQISQTVLLLDFVFCFVGRHGKRYCSKCRVTRS